MRKTRYIPLPLSTLALSLVLIGLAGDARAQPGRLALESAAGYRARARFPESSRPLEAADPDPVLAKRVPAPHSLATPGTEGLLTLWAQEVSFPVGTPVELHVAITGLAPAEIAVTEVTGEVVDQSGEVLGAVTYADDGKGSDAVRRDGTFSARFTLPKGREPELAEAFLVRVTAVRPDGERLEAAGGFLVSNPHARLTGEVAHRVEGGNLVVSVAVEVDRPGRFHLAGTLATMKGEPVAWAQTAQPLAAGSHKLELIYHGLIFHDRGVTGPLRVATLALENASAMPNALAPLVEDAAVIPALPLAELTRTPFGDPALLDAAKRLEAGVAPPESRR